MKFVRDKAHCKYELSVIKNIDLKDIVESGYFVFGEGITDNYKNGNIPYVPLSKGLTLINTVNESSEIYNINQIIINGMNLYYRSFQLLKSDKSLRENSMSPWGYKSLGFMPTLDDISQDIYTDGGPVYAGYKIDGNPVYVARHSFDFDNTTAVDISADYVEENTILVKFDGMRNQLGYHIPLDYVYVSDSAKSFDATTIQCALDVGGKRIRLQAKESGDAGYVDMYFYNQQ